MIKNFSVICFAIVLQFGCVSESEDINFTTQFDWEASTLAEQGIDKKMIDEAIIEASELNYLYSLIIIRNEKLVYEKYFNGHDSNSQNNIRSVSKSYLSAAAGIAINDGVFTLNDNLTQIIDQFNSQIVDNRFSDVTIRHLLQMRSGLDKDVNIYMDVYNSENWLSNIFSRRLINNPGQTFVYSTPATHLLSAIITKATGMSSYKFMTDTLLSKMGIELGGWDQDPQGIYFGGNNMYFTTRNMAVLGLLYLNEGKINGNQIVPKSFVNTSLVDHTGGIGDWGIMKNIGYGYLWWLGEISNKKVFTAIGHGGQFILCVPKLNLIVATNAHSNIGWEQANNQELEILNIIGTYIIPAINE